MSNKALIVIDYTVDFVADEGNLTCGKAGQILENYILSLVSETKKKGELVIMSVDHHIKDDKYHPESKLFPPHNIEGTTGRFLYGSLSDWYSANADEDNVKWIDKTRYSSFTGTNLELILRSREINEIHLVGVCTDICVLHTAVDAYNKGYKVVIHEKGVGSFNEIGHEWALNHFRNVLGFEIV